MFCMDGTMGKHQKITNVEFVGGLAKRIKELRAEHANLLRRGAAYAKEIGDLLNEARPFFGYQWSKWLATEFDMTSEAARKYTVIANGWHKIESHERFPNLSVIEM